MKAHLVALKLVADASSNDVDASTLESRKLFQKVVYLVQRCGLDLGYRFAWDEMGPYCPKLSEDYRHLHRVIQLAPVVG